MSDDTWRDILLDGYISDGVAMAAKQQGITTCGELLDAINDLGFDSVDIMLKSSGAMASQIESGVALIRRLRDTGEPHYNAIVNRKGDQMGKVSKPSAEVIDIGAQFKTWSGLGETSSIGFAINEPREPASLNRAKRLQELGQTEFDKMTTVLIEAVADSRSLGVSTDHYTGRLSFKTDDITNNAMRKLVNQPGRIIAKRIGDIGGDDGSGNDAEGTPLLDGDGNDDNDGGDE
jgi:hypothetical protein